MQPRRLYVSYAAPPLLPLPHSTLTCCFRAPLVQSPPRGRLQASSVGDGLTSSAAGTGSPHKHGALAGRAGGDGGAAGDGRLRGRGLPSRRRRPAVAAALTRAPASAAWAGSRASATPPGPLRVQGGAADTSRLGRRLGHDPLWPWPLRSRSWAVRWLLRPPLALYVWLFYTGRPDATTWWRRPEWTAFHSQRRWWHAMWCYLGEPVPGQGARPALVAAAT